MKLYHYVAKPNTVLKEGILSFAQNPSADLRYYFKRSEETTHDGIIKWMEACFEGRSRGVRAFTEPIKWSKNSLSLKKFIDNAYFSPSVMDVPTLKEENYCDELLIRLYDYKDIKVRPVDWTVCNDELGRRFAFVPYYVIVIKGGVIAPKYLILEDDCHQK